MTPRKFAIGLMIAAATLFVGTAAANLLIDPVAVFGTDLFPYRYPNYRYLGFLYYKRESRSVDAILFSSSRGFWIDKKLLADRLGAEKLHSQAVPYGLITDHLPMLAYALRDKAAHGEKLKSVVLLIDTDLLGKPAWTNVNIDCFLPPELTGGTYARFWWRYLTAVQLSSWREGIRRAINHIPSPNPTGMDIHLLREGGANNLVRNRVAGDAAKKTFKVAMAGLPALSPGALLVDSAAALQFDDANLSVATQAPDDRFAGYWRTRRPEIEKQFQMIETFVRLCREYGVNLTVATSPLRRDNINLYLPGELEAIGRRLNTIVDVWDFATPGPMSDNPNVWEDYAHFTSIVGAMMINRMFGGAPTPEGFGQFRPKTNQ